MSDYEISELLCEKSKLKSKIICLQRKAVKILYECEEKLSEIDNEISDCIIKVIEINNKIIQK